MNRETREKGKEDPIRDATKIVMASNPTEFGGVREAGR